MKGKTIFIITITILLTLFLMDNKDAVDFNFIFVDDVPVSKLAVIGICILIGFILGFVVGRPRKTYSSYNNEIERDYPQPQEKQSTLSDEDRDYIS